jgi:hypothetical protein
VMTITILSAANAVGNEGFYCYAAPLNGGDLRIAAWGELKPTPHALSFQTTSAALPPASTSDS